GGTEGTARGDRLRRWRLVPFDDPLGESGDPFQPHVHLSGQRRGAVAETAAGGDGGASGSSGEPRRMPAAFRHGSDRAGTRRRPALAVSPLGSWVGTGV